MTTIMMVQLRYELILLNEVYSYTVYTVQRIMNIYDEDGKIHLHWTQPVRKRYIPTTVDKVLTQV